MQRSVRILAVTATSFSLLFGLQVQVANAAFDQTPPTLTVQAKPAFVVGNILAAPSDDPEAALFTYGIAQQLTWSATDDVAVCWYDLDLVPAGAPPQPILEFSQETQYVFPAGSDYDGTFGGGSAIVRGFLVTARDCEYNSTTRAVPDRPRVTQENNASGIAETSPWGEVTYTGSWGTGACACFLQGLTARTTTRGATATFTRTYEEGDHVALVMAQGPGRGRAAIRVDGFFVGTIDTFAEVNTNRVVVFERMMSAGTHTVTITNFATPGRARIDLDAVMTN
jgi:hypothetical protein